MSAEDLNLTGVRTLDQALARTKNGNASVELAKRMGLWSTDLHTNAQERKSFPTTMSDLTPSQLTDLNATWTAELGRVLEICGAIDGQLNLLKIQLKRAQSGARARILRKLDADAKVPTQAALNDLAEEDPAVSDLQDQFALLSVLESHAQAARDATERYLATISREISFRDSQIKGRIYG